MNETPAVFTLIVVVVTSFISWKAFTRPDLQQKLIFDPRLILTERDYHRLVTSGFIHANWGHLIFNMFSFYLFAEVLEFKYGWTQLAFIYFASIIGGGLLCLFVHRNHFYQALGASGGVAGVIFATIFLAPGTSVGLIFIPFIFIPGWAFAILYLAYSFYAMRNKNDNIGHDAHIGGALIGVLAATSLHPEIVPANPILYPTVLIIGGGILYYLIASPLGLPLHKFRSPTRVRHESPKRRPTPAEDDARTNALLEKISKKGLHSLTPEEHAYLKRKSRRR